MISGSLRLRGGYMTKHKHSWQIFESELITNNVCDRFVVQGLEIPCGAVYVSEWACECGSLKRVFLTPEYEVNDA